MNDESLYALQKILCYDRAKEQFGESIACTVLREINALNEPSVQTITQHDYFQVCQRVFAKKQTDGIYNLDSYVCTCVQNMQNHKIRRRRNLEPSSHQNSFNQFEQRSHNFVELEKLLQDN